jgi:hypothetical protein
MEQVSVKRVFAGTGVALRTNLTLFFIRNAFDSMHLVVDLACYMSIKPTKK